MDAILKTDSQILSSAVVITAIDANMPRRVREIGILLRLVRMLDQGSEEQFYIAYWPDGPAALLNGNPSDKQNWDNLLINTYRQATSGVMGPVESEGV